MATIRTFNVYSILSTSFKPRNTGKSYRSRQDAIAECAKLDKLWNTNIKKHFVIESVEMV